IHGASGISDQDLITTIHLGHDKINLKTEINIAWSNQLRQTLKQDKTLFNPQQMLKPSRAAMVETSRSIIYKCTSYNRV
ncbi:2-deoxy-5-keto-D-gluconic acid 6-phosphate aldolase, partial [Mammaliicoccus sciuri]